MNGLNKFNVLIVVDMQNDLVFGDLKSERSIGIVKPVIDKINKYVEDKNGVIIFTKHTNFEDLENENEKDNQKKYCIYNTEGWELIDPIKEIIEEYRVNQGNVTKMTIVEKNSFGASVLGNYAFADLGIQTNSRHASQEVKVEVIGLHTDTSVLSNVVIAKSFLPNARVLVDEYCCAGTSGEAQATALKELELLHTEIYCDVND
jgi:nicotinamidase-related amidase